MEALAKVVVGYQYCETEDRELTVRMTSHFCPNDGLGAYDHRNGELAFRVDNYGNSFALNDELVLMDPCGACIVTLQRKWRSLHSRWEGYLGERTEGQKPLFSVRRTSIFGDGRRCISVEVQGGDGTGEEPPVGEYRVEGSFAARNCRVLYIGDEEEVVAMIKRKVADPCPQVVLGRDVFSLHLLPHVDAAFVMGLLLVLDRISDDEGNEDVVVDPTTFTEAKTADRDVGETHC